MFNNSKMSTNMILRHSRPGGGFMTNQTTNQNELTIDFDCPDYVTSQEDDEDCDKRIGNYDFNQLKSKQRDAAGEQAEVNDIQFK